MAVNWKKGLRRVVFLLSILAIIPSAVGLYKALDSSGFYTPEWVDDILSAIDSFHMDGFYNAGEWLLLLIVLVIGGAAGFGAVWLVYLFLERLFSWLARGFQDVTLPVKTRDKKPKAEPDNK